MPTFGRRNYYFYNLILSPRGAQPCLLRWGRVATGTAAGGEELVEVAVHELRAGLVGDADGGQLNPVAGRDVRGVADEARDLPCKSEFERKKISLRRHSLKQTVTYC